MANHADHVLRPTIIAWRVRKDDCLTPQELVREAIVRTTLWVRDLHDSRANPSTTWCVSTIVSTSLSTIQFIKVRPGLGQAARVHHCVHHLRRAKTETFAKVGTGQNVPQPLISLGRMRF